MAEENGLAIFLHRFVIQIVQTVVDVLHMTMGQQDRLWFQLLIPAKGFADPVVSISSGKVDVVVNAPSITDAQRAQIEDIVKRKAPADYREKLEEVIGREAITASLQENGLTEKIFTAGEKDVTKILADRRKQMALEIKEFYKTL